jgi:hypothetical protein
MKRSLFAIALLCSTGAAAQDSAMTEAKAVGMSKTENATMGWKWTVKTVGGFNVVDKKNVVGQTDDKTQIYSLKLGTGIDHFTDNTEWKNSLDLAEVFTRTQAMDRLVKSSDELKLLTFYKHFFSAGSMFGAYARGSLETTALDSYDERGGDTNYTVTRTDGSSKTKTDDRYKTAGAFKPMTTKESTGLIARVLTNPLYTVEVRTGLAAKQFYGKGAYQVADDTDPANIVLAEIPDTRVAGLEFATELNGATSDKKLTYKACVESLYPFAYSPKGDDEPEASKLVSTEAGLDATVAILEWMGLSYSAKSKRDPQLQPKSQVTHSLLATVTFATGN